jgi:hypothetical protein
MTHVCHVSRLVWHGSSNWSIIFQEVETINTKNRKSLKSILKSDSNFDSNNQDREPSKKGTKKVKISTDNIEYSDSYKNKNKTRKARLVITT